MDYTREKEKKRKNELETERERTDYMDSELNNSERCTESNKGEKHIHGCFTGFGSSEKISEECADPAEEGCKTLSDSLYHMISPFMSIYIKHLTANRVE